MGLIGGHRVGLCCVMFDDDFEAEWAAYSQPGIDPKCRLADGKADAWAIVDFDLRYLVAET